MIIDLSKHRNHVYLWSMTSQKTETKWSVETKWPVKMQKPHDLWSLTSINAWTKWSIVIDQSKCINHVVYDHWPVKRQKPCLSVVNDQSKDRNQVICGHRPVKMRKPHDLWSLTSINAWSTWSVVIDQSKHKWQTSYLKQVVTSTRENCSVGRNTVTIYFYHNITKVTTLA